VEVKENSKNSKEKKKRIGRYSETKWEARINNEGSKKIWEEGEERKSRRIGMMNGISRRLQVNYRGNSGRRETI